MSYILNYKKSQHFEERLKQRQIDPFLVSMCLTKGCMKRMNKNKIEYTLFKDSILKTIDQGYILACDCLNVISLTVVTRDKLLITVFAKFGDTGVNNQKDN